MTELPAAPGLGGRERLPEQTKVREAATLYSEFSAMSFRAAEPAAVHPAVWLDESLFRAGQPRGD